MLQRIKRIFILILAIMLFSFNVSAIDLFVDLSKIETDTPPTVVDGRTLIPVRAIFESLGAEVKWDTETRTAIGSQGNTIVRIQIDNTTAYINDEAMELDVPAQIINERTMVPARFISEALGCKVTWYEKTSTASIADKLKNQPIYVTQYGKHYHFSGNCNGGTYYEASLAEAMGRGLTPCDKCVLTNEYYQALSK